MSKRAIGLWVCGLLVAISLGQVKVVTLKNGGQLQGEVTKTDTGYRVKQLPSGIVSVVPDSDVLSVADAQTPRDEYKERLAKLDASSATQQFDLGEWAFRNGMLDEAKARLDASLKIDSQNVRAKVLLLQVEGMIARRDESKTATTQAPGNEAGESLAGFNPDQLVGEPDIFRIRLEELRDSDHVPVAFKNGVLERFVQMMQGREDFSQAGQDKAFMALSPVAKALYIRDAVGPENSSYKDDIEVQGDPQFMTDFRTQIWPMLAALAAMPEHHGGLTADGKAVGGFRLFNAKALPTRVLYTNFLILDSFETGGWRMINRNDPELSLLIQYGLPPELAEMKHPTKIPVMFTGRDAPNYRRAVDWIRSLRGPIHPSYRIQWKPPFGMKLNLSGRPSLPEAASQPQSPDSAAGAAPAAATGGQVPAPQTP
jgi:hypothetical protein